MAAASIITVRVLIDVLPQVSIGIKAINVRREYTKADVKELRAHSKAKTAVVKIMKLTKRTEGSLRQKALTLGIKLGHRR
jgi:hypothetical protein